MCVAGESLDTVETYSIIDDEWSALEQKLPRSMRIFGAVVAPANQARHSCVQTFQDVNLQTSESRKAVARFVEWWVCPRLRADRLSHKETLAGRA